MSQNVVYPMNSCVFHPSRLKKVSLTQHGIAVGRMYLRRGASVELAGLDIDVERWVIENLCPQLNAPNLG